MSLPFWISRKTSSTLYHKLRILAWDIYKFQFSSEFVSKSNKLGSRWKHLIKSRFHSWLWKMIFRNLTDWKSSVNNKSKQNFVFENHIILLYQRSYFQFFQDIYVRLQNNMSNNYFTRMIKIQLCIYKIELGYKLVQIIHDFAWISWKYN